MRCKNCESLLWKQPPAAAGQERRCSECGTPYRPSEFDFVRSKVRFACPHCATGYYGTSERGHLEPAAFECVTCHNAITMDECVLEPEGVEQESEAMQRTGIPWLEGRRGVRAWGATVLLGIVKPAHISGFLPQRQRAAAAMWFLCIQSWLAMFPLVCCCAAFGFTASTAGGATSGQLWWRILTVVLTVLVVAPVAASACVASAALFARFAGQREEGGYAKDIETACYASGPLLAIAVPGYGWVLLPWWFVAASIALAYARPQGNRLAAGILACIGFVVPWIVVVVVAILS